MRETAHKNPIENHFQFLYPRHKYSLTKRYPPMSKLLYCLSLSYLFAFSTFAAAQEEDHDHEHGLGHIVGENIDVAYTDHAFAGTIGGTLIFASPLEGEFGVKLVHRAAGKDYESSFRKVDNRFVGTVSTPSENNSLRETTFALTSVNAADGVIEGTLDNDSFIVLVKADEMEGNHYVNPTFIVSVGEKNFSFKLEGGEACIGCATKISFVVLSMLRTTGKI
jgi:hypothetical protein